MEALGPLDSVVIRQEKEWTEILTGFETRNRYQVMDTDGRKLFVAAEVAGSLLARLFLRAARPFRIHIVEDGTTLLSLRRPFRFYFGELDVIYGQGSQLGSVRRRFALLRRIYTVFDETESPRFELFGPILRPWTFRIMQDGQEIGQIQKKWSGLLKEAMTDADTFGVRFPSDLDVAGKTLLLGAVFLIDFVHFEDSRGPLQTVLNIVSD